MAEKWLGWPDATNIGGHMIKRLGAPETSADKGFRCEDCGLTDPGTTAFTVGSEGCPARPESIPMWIKAPEGAYETAHIAQKAREQFLNMTGHVGLPVKEWTPIAYEDVVAEYTFGNDRYVVRLNPTTFKITTEKEIKG
jgi:hypothetical protein